MHIREVREGPWRIYIFEDFDMRNAEPSHEFFETLENASAHIRENLPADIRRKFEDRKRAGGI